MSRQMFFDPASCQFYSGQVHAEIPAGAVPLTDTEYDTAMALQETVGPLVTGPDGRPTVRLPTAEEAAAAARYRARARRRAALLASDYRAAADYPQTDAERAAWAAYRTALRDWPAQPGWPDLPLPTPPG